MFGYFGIIDHSSWLDNAFSDIPDGIKQLLHVLTAVNMRNKHIYYLVISLCFFFFPFSFFLFFVFFLILSYRDCLLFLLTFLLTHDTSFDIWMPGYLVYLLIYSEVHINRLLVLHEGRGTLVEKTGIGPYSGKNQNWGFFGHFL